MSFLSDTSAIKVKGAYVNGLLDCSGNVLLRAGNVIIGNLDYPNFNINNKSLHVNGGTTFNGNVTINSSTTTSSFLSISSQTGNSIAIGRGAVANGGNSIAIGNVALINGFTNSVAIGAGASCTADNQIVLGTASQSVNIPGSITLGSGATAPTSAQLGFYKQLTGSGTFTAGSLVSGTNEGLVGTYCVQGSFYITTTQVNTSVNYYIGTSLGNYIDYQSAFYAVVGSYTYTFTAVYGSSSSFSTGILIQLASGGFTAVSTNQRIRYVKIA